MTPTTAEVRIRFTLPASDRAGITIFDISGREIARMPEATYGPGEHQLVWDLARTDGSRAGAGVYFLRFTSRLHAATRKVVALN